MAIKIYIDQGHNPRNPNAGAEGNGYREQDLVFAIGRELAEILREEGYETRLSRPTAETQLGNSNATSLAARVNEANYWGADYFLSLHANASENAAASGTEALVYRQDSTAAALANSILRYLTRATGLRDRGVTVRPNLYVLRRTRMPAVLLELGFITNPDDARLMAENPGLFALGIAQGITAYLNGDAPASVLPDETVPSETQITYAQFLMENPKTGTLKVQAYRGDQAYPVSGAQVTVSQTFADGEHLFFTGVTDEDGLIENITLPAPPKAESQSPEHPQSTAVYRLTATHPSYGSITEPVYMYEDVTAIQPLAFSLREV